MRLHDGIAVTVDSATGLKAWCVKRDNRLLATMPIPSCQHGTAATPTALAIDTSGSGSGTIHIAVGFSDGASSIYHFLVDQQHFMHRYTNHPSSHGAVEAIAYSAPHLLTMTDPKLLSLYHLDLAARTEEKGDKEPLLRLLASLKSHTAWPPLSLAIRSLSNNIFASIAYAMPTYLAGWSVGLQELRLTLDGTILESRLASADSHGFSPLCNSQPPSPNRTTDSPLRNKHDWESSPHLTKPTALSYSHPYILAAHPDNTLTFYVVTSDANTLFIGPGHRLWGHTSSVSGAHVGERGKAVSVSRHGNDLRVWELESGLYHGNSKRRTADNDSSVRIRPEGRNPKHGGFEDKAKFEAPRQGSYMEESAMQNGWVAFDDETVVLLKEDGEGAQVVVVYDFS